MQCPYCNNEHPDEADFCPITGHSLRTSSISSVACPHCGGIVPPGAQFCPDCGKAIEEVTGPEQPIKKAAPSLIKCANCGESLPPEAQFCPVCGTAVAKTVDVEKVVLPLPKFINGNSIKFVGVAALVIVVVLIVFYKWPHGNSSQAFVAAQTKTSIARQKAAAPALKSNKYPSPTQPVIFSTPTDIPTDTIPATLPPTQAPTEPVRKSCSGAPPIRIEVGDKVEVININDSKFNALDMRSKPIVGSNISWGLGVGTELQVLDGPVCSNDVSFFYVRDLDNGNEGWVAEAKPETNNNKDYNLSPPLN